jgi:hypothetical protein
MPTALDNGQLAPRSWLAKIVQRLIAAIGRPQRRAKSPRALALQLTGP